MKYKLYSNYYSNYYPSQYNSEDIFGVVFRLNASVWKDVLPFCLVNSSLAYGVLYYSQHFQDITINDSAHRFMSFTVAYLVVNRTTLCLERYMNARSLLCDLTRSSKELIHHAVAFTRYKNKDRNLTQWRISLAKRTISILRVVVSILKLPSKKKNVWEESSIAKFERQALLLAVGKSNERSPLVLALFLRSLIASHIHTITPPLEDPQETCLHDITNNFISAYADLMAQISTPQPFPMVQMTRTFLFAYVFTLPFVLANAITQAPALIFMTFFITYGLIGLELSNIEMDDPFGTDPNDFNVEAIARNAYRDILVLIHDIDGDEAAAKVRKSLSESIKEGVKKTVNQHTQFTRIDEWRGTAMGSQIDEIAHEVQIIVHPDSLLPSNKSDTNDTTDGGDDDYVHDIDDNGALNSTPPDILQNSSLMEKLYQRMNSGSPFTDIHGEKHTLRDSWVVRK